MNQPAALEAPVSPLIKLLREQFSRRRMQAAVGGSLEPLDWRLWSRALYEPLLEFLNRPGKEFRARLVDTSYQLAGGKVQCPERLQLLVEVLHAGSLIVDDIEDGSELRRGKPALHRLFGVPTALNAGNWLYFWAFALVEQIDLGPHVELSMHRWLGQTLLRCHFGQALDLDVRMGALEQEQVFDVVATSTRLKTGCLIELSAALGAIAAGASRETVQALGDFGSDVGIGLQMLDDISGLTNPQRRHKGREDLRLGRPTWPWAWLSQSLTRSRYSALRSIAREVENGQGDAAALAETIQMELGDRGSALIRRHQQEAFERLTSSIGSSHATTKLKRELRHLEKSYG